MKREKSRECTFLLLFSNDFHAANEVAKQLDMLIENQNDINENKEDPIIAKEADREYITARVIDIEKNIEEIDKKINEVAVGWSTERMSKVDLTILRLAYYEMKMDEEVPQKAVSYTHLYWHYRFLPLLCVLFITYQLQQLVHGLQTGLMTVCSVTDSICLE